MHGNLGPGHPQGHLRLFGEGKLATGPESPEQDHRLGVLHGGRDRARPDLTADPGGVALQKRAGNRIGTAQGAGQEQAGCLPPRNRGPAGQRLDPEVHRPALSHHRGQPAQLAKKTRPKNITTALSLIKFYGTLVSFV